MSQPISVIVGVRGRKDTKPERERLADCIEAKGFLTKRLNVCWPRDHFVRSADQYVVFKKQGICGEGGVMHVGADHMLVSELLFKKSYFQWTDEDVKTDNGAIEKRMGEYYPQKHIHVVPVGCSPTYRTDFYDYRQDLSYKWHRHIDLTTLLIPSRKLLIVDGNFYENEYYTSAIKDNPFEKFRCIAAQEDLTLELFRPNISESFWYFPLNCLILPTQEVGETIVVNECVPSLVPLLHRYDLQVISTVMEHTPKELGSIRCCTNVCDDTVHVDDLIDEKN